eukprot:6184807-Pleurochrysis_carterae.AAC.4
MPDISTPPRNGCLTTPEAYILARGVTTIPYHIVSSFHNARHRASSRNGVDRTSCTAETGGTSNSGARLGTAASAAAAGARRRRPKGTQTTARFTR